jgi:hypothetical protein
VFHSIPLHHILSSFISHFISFPFLFPRQFFSCFTFSLATRASPWGREVLVVGAQRLRRLFGVVWLFL